MTHSFKRVIVYYLLLLLVSEIYYRLCSGTKVDIHFLVKGYSHHFISPTNPSHFYTIIVLSKQHP
jgi:hypothetical protein